MADHPTPPPSDQDLPVADLLARRCRPERAGAKAQSIVDLLGMPGPEVEHEPLRFDLVLRPGDLD